MGRIKNCESCGAVEWKHAAELYDGTDYLVCWECEVGAKFEQERIIKLLEKQLCDSPDCSESYGHNTCQLWLAAIALIKGENK